MRSLFRLPLTSINHPIALDWRTSGDPERRRIWAVDETTTLFSDRFSHGKVARSICREGKIQHLKELDLGHKLRRSADSGLRRKREGWLFYSKRARYPPRDWLLRASVELSFESRIQANAYAPITVRRLEVTAPDLPNVTLFTEVKEDIDVVISSTLKRYQSRLVFEFF